MNGCLQSYFKNTSFFNKKQNDIETYKCVYINHAGICTNFISELKNVCLENNIGLYKYELKSKKLDIIKIDKNQQNYNILLKPRYYNKQYIERTIKLANTKQPINLHFNEIDIVIVSSLDILNKITKSHSNSIIILLTDHDTHIPGYTVIKTDNKTRIFQKKSTLNLPFYYKQPKKPLIIMGNGPSLNNLISLDLHKVSKKYDTIGLNSAYKYFSKINWFPTYYGSFDSKVTPCQSKNIIEYIRNSNGKTQKYLTIKQFLPKQFLNIYFIDARNSHRHFNPNWWYSNTGDSCSGHNALKFALQEGYKEIYLIGVDANYIDYIDGAGSNGNGLIINKKPINNPNYFHNDYQEVGDVYNVPHAGCHINSWNEAFVNIEYNKHLNIKIYNSSKISKVKCFTFKEIVI